MRCKSRYLTLLLILLWHVPLLAQERPRRVYVPLEELNVVLDRDKRGVVLPRAEFEALLKAARKADSERQPSTPLVITASDYEGRIVGEQLALTANVTLSQFDDGWQITPLSWKRLAVEQAELDNEPARLSRDARGTLRLLTQGRGEHQLAMELSTELTAVGSDRVAAFGLIPAPTGTLALTVPAGKQLVVNGVVLDRPAKIDQPADYRIAVGGQTSLTLQITDRAAEQTAESLVFATTAHGLNVTPGEVTWQAISTLQVFGRPMDRVELSIPGSLEITGVESSGLQAWELTDDPQGGGRTLVTLRYAQPFDGGRDVTLRGVMATEPDRPWTAPTLLVRKATSHIGRVVVQHPPAVRVRVEEHSGVRQSAEVSGSESLRFDLWQEEFSLRFVTQPKERELQAAVASVVNVGTAGIDLEASITVETHFAPLFEVDLTLPAEWELMSASVDGRSIAWQVRTEEAGIRQLRLPLPTPLGIGQSTVIRLQAHLDPDGWPGEQEPMSFPVPEVHLPKATLSEGTLVVRSDPDFEVTAAEVVGLDPSPTKHDWERLRYVSQDTRYSGTLVATRKPPRVAARTLSFVRLESQSLHTHFDILLNIQGGGLRTLQITLPESAGDSFQFVAPQPQAVRIAEQEVSPVENAERTWTLQFDRRVKGPVLLTADVPMPRPEGDSIRPPTVRIAEADLQNGYVALEAGPEQQLQITARGADGVPLPEVDPLDLPSSRYQPQERIVAIYRYVAPGYTLTLSEDRFARMAVPTAVCHSLSMTSVLGTTGQLQHWAAFQLSAVGVQNLRVQLPEDSRLLATLLDGQPVEVRQTPDAYLLPLPVASSPDQSRKLELFYETQTKPLQRFTTLRQSAPVVSAVTGQGTEQSLDVLQHDWNLHYPDSTLLIRSEGPLQPKLDIDRSSLLGQLRDGFRAPTLREVLWQTLAATIGLGIIVLIARAYRQSGVAGLILGAALIGCLAILAMLILPIMQSARESARHSTELAASRPSKPLQSEAAGGSAATPPPPTAAPEPAVADAPAASEPAELQIGAQDELFGMQPAQPPQGPRDGEEAGRAVAAPQEPVPAGETPRRPAGGLLSLAVNLEPPQGTRQTSFSYTGTQTAQSGLGLDVTFENRRAGIAYRLFLALAVAALFWFLRDITPRRRWLLAILGVTLPLALATVVPARWQLALDGLLVGTLAGIGLWFVAILVRRASAVTAFRSVLIFAAVLAATEGRAQEQSADSLLDAVLIPYAEGQDPLAAERVYLPHDKFVELWNKAHPEQRLKAPAPEPGAVAEALYDAALSVDEQMPEQSRIAITGRLALFNWTQQQITLDLPLGPVALREAKLDGQPAALTPHNERWRVVLSEPGLHVLDLQFDLPAQRTGPAGQFTLPLSPVPAGKLTFTLPEPDLAVRVNGSSTAYRRRTQGDKTFIEVPIDRSENLSLSWYPEQHRRAADAVVHAETTTAVTISDSGVLLSTGVTVRVRQGGLSEMSFALPTELHVQSITGPDVGGWEVDDRNVRVLLRRTVDDSTQITFDLYLKTQIGHDVQTVEIPSIAPREVLHETGVIGVFTGEAFLVSSGRLQNLSQIDVSRFTPTAIVHCPQGTAPQLAYRYTSRPFTLSLQMTRQSAQAQVAARHGVFVELRKLRQTSQLSYELSGAPRGSLAIELPEDFLLLNLTATDLADWYITDDDGYEVLVIEFQTPRTGTVEVVLEGTVARDANTDTADLMLPRPLEVSRLDSQLAVWLDDVYTARLEQFDGWRMRNTIDLAAELLGLRPTSPNFGFQTADLEPLLIVLNLERAVPQITADALSLVTVTDPAVEYALALQWQIEAATTDTLSLTTPDWLAGKLEFQGEGIRQVLSSEAGPGRTRWTIFLRSPVQGRYFVTATGTLPPADQQVEAPSLVFEHEGTPLETQRHYAMLINLSRGQLTAIDPARTEPVQQADLPLTVRQSLIDQATELVRVRDRGNPPVWQLERFAQEPGLPASVNVADLLTVLAKDGTWRAQATYTIRNRTRQFLALVMPENVRVLSVFVQGQPSRAAETRLETRTVQLIALPKTSAADLAFQVVIVYAGRLPGPLPSDAQLLREEIALQAPQVVSLKESERFGIPVASTRWTVYLPEDLHAEPVRSVQKHNLTFVPPDAADLTYQKAWLQELRELASVVTSAKSRRTRELAYNNLKQLQQHFEGSGAYDRAVPSDERQMFEKERQKVLEQVQELDQQVRAEPEQVISNGAKGIVLDDAQQTELALGNAATLLRDNPSTGMSRFDKEMAEEFRFRLKDGIAATMEQSQPAQSESRVQLRVQNEEQIAALNSVIVQNAAPQTPSQQDGSRPDVTEQRGRDKNGQFGGFGGGLADFDVAEFFQAQPKAAGMLGAEPVRPWSQAGGLSLPIQVLTTGQKLVFTKVGGEPRLALHVGSREAVQTGLGWIWTLVWLSIAAGAVVAIRRPDSRHFTRQPLAIAILSLVLYFVLLPPLSWLAFAAFLVASFIAATN